MQEIHLAQIIDDGLFVIRDSLRGELDAHDTTSQSALQLISDHSGIKCNWPLLATVFVYMAHSLTTNWREEI